MTVSAVASVLTMENKKELLGKIRQKSEREVEAILATYRPPVDYRDRARPVCVAVAASSMRDRVRPVCVAVPERLQQGSVMAAATGASHSRTGSGKSPVVGTGGVPVLPHRE